MIEGVGSDGQVVAEALKMADPDALEKKGVDLLGG